MLILNLWYSHTSTTFSGSYLDEDFDNLQVLIMDEVTVKVMSCSCKMADITDEGISRTYYLFSLRFLKHYILHSL